MREQEFLVLSHDNVPNLLLDLLEVLANHPVDVLLAFITASLSDDLLSFVA